MKSRRNSLKHGLTGAGIVIPDEDVAAVQERIEAFTADLKPKNDVAGFLATRAAVLSVRMDRCVRQEAASITHEMIEADADQAEARAEDLAYFIDLIPKEPARAVRNLLYSPEGIDWLILAWRELLALLFDPNTPRFSYERAQQLSGRTSLAYRDSRMGALAAALSGNFSYLEADDRPDPERREAARAELKQLIEAEIARLGGVRNNLDLAAIARDRAGAKARAIFNPSPEATLARKYEAAAERAFFKTLKEIERINAQAEESKEVVATAETNEDCGDLASFSPEEEPEIPPTIRRRSRGPSTIPSPSGTGLQGPDEALEEARRGETGTDRSPHEVR